MLIFDIDVDFAGKVKPAGPMPIRDVRVKETTASQ